MRTTFCHRRPTVLLGYSFVSLVPMARMGALLALVTGLLVACHRHPQARLAQADVVATANLPAATVADEALAFVDAEALLAEAEPLWAARDELDKLQACIGLWERALVQRPGDGALASRLSRAQFLLGYGHLRPAHDVVGTKQAFARGMLVGEQALLASSAPYRAAVDGGGAIEDALVTVDAAGVDALTWYVANLGGFAAAKGSTTALFYAERLRAGIERLLAVDERYFHATPHRFMGIYLANVPAFAGGSLKRSRAHFERALALSPGYFDNALAYAGAYATAKHDRGLYARLLHSVSAGNPAALPDVAAELRLQQRQVAQLTAQPNAEKEAQRAHP